MTCVPKLIPNRTAPPVTLENPQSTNRQEFLRGARRRERQARTERRLRPGWPPLLQSVPLLALALPSTGRCGNPPSALANCWDLPTLNTRARTRRLSRVMETLGEPRPRGRSLQPELGELAPGWSRPPSPEDGAQPPKPCSSGGSEAGRGRRGRRLRAPEALAEPGGLRGRAERGAGMGRGGRGPERGRPEGAAGEGRAGGGGYKPYTLKRRALSSGRTLTSPVHPAAHGCSRRTPTLKATGRSDCNGRDSGSRETLAPDPLNFHRHPPPATKQRPHAPERSHTCCLRLSANHERLGHTSANQDEAMLHPCRGIASLTNRRQ